MPGLLLFLLACPCGGAHGVPTDEGRRRYLVHVPEGHDGVTPLPVVMVLHGGGGNAEGTRDTLGMDALADAEGFMVVYPEGTGPRRLGQDFLTWNAGACCGEAAAQGVDDVGFLEAVLDDLAARYPVDAARVYATGISNGGAMAHRLACEAPERLAAIASVASPGAAEVCVDPAPMPTLIVHGTGDRCTPYAGGDACGGCWEEAMALWLDREVEPEVLFPCQGAEAQVAARLAWNGCSGEPALTHQQGQATCQLWSSCDTGAAVSLCVLAGAGHVWPGSAAGCEPGTDFCDAYTEVVGPFTDDLDANRHIWSFFQSRARAE